MKKEVDEFMGDFIQKDLTSIRKKGVWMEDTCNWFCTQIPHITKTWWPEEDIAGYHENFYEGEVTLHDGKKVSVKFVWCCARMGIPSLIVGTKTKEDWIAVRGELRDLNLVR